MKMKQVDLIVVLGAVLAMITLAETPQFKQPSSDEVALMERASPARSTVRPKKARKVLVVSQCEGFPHSAIPYCSKAFEIMGRKTGAFSTVVVDDLSILEKPEFDTFDAIIMNNTTIRLPLLAGADEARETLAQKRFLDFVRSGKGLVGVHAATDCLSNWPEYGELIGGYFNGHPWNEEVRVKLEDPSHPLLSAFKGLDFSVADEIYEFRNVSRDSLRVLMSLDVKKTNMGKEKIKRTDNDFAVAWLHEYGKGRVFYFSLGHRHEIFWTPSILQCYLDGLQYALGDLQADATPSAKLKASDLEQSRTAAFAVGMESMLADLAGYTLSGNVSLAQQVDQFVDEHLSDSLARRGALSKGLAKVVDNPQATVEGRALACRKLSMVGDDNAIATLAKFIDDKHMGNWSRYALARMPGKAVDKVLVDALNRTKGQDRLAVAVLVGERRIASGISALADLAASTDAAAGVAAEALGQIGGEAAVDALAKLLPLSKGAVRQAVDRALLNSGDSERIKGNRKVALKAYALLDDAETVEYLRGAAFYGRNMLAGKDGVKAAVAALKGSPGECARAGARLTQDLPEKSVVPSVAGALKDMPQANQIIALAALAARGDRAAQDGVLERVASESADVRISALSALEELGDKRAVKTVMGVASSAQVDKPSRNSARKALNAMNGPGVNDEIVAAMRVADVATKTEYAKVLGARKARGALDVLLDAARDADAGLAEESRKSISLLAQAEDLPELVKLVTDTSDAGALKQLENIVVKAAKTTAKEDLKTAAVLKALKQKIPVEARCSLLMILGRIYTSSSLSALIAAFKDTDAVVRRAALKATAEYWPDAEPLLVLREASLSDRDEQCRVLALSGYARLLAMPSKRPVKDTLKLYREALDLAKGTQEKRALIVGLGSLVHKEALAFVSPFLNDGGVQAEALEAALNIRKGLNGGAMVLTSSVGGMERNALDGDPKTRWTTGSSATGGEWFTVDLGYEDDIQTVYLDAGPVGNDQPQGYEVYVSLDGKSWAEPVAKGDDPKKKAFTITFAPKYGRFVKVVQTKPHGMNWSINEIRVNGVPDLKSLPPLDRAKWKASAFNSPGNDQPKNAIDGDLSTRWGTGGAMKPGDWFAVDMGGEHTVYEVVMNAAKSGGDYPRGYQLFTSADGKNWYGPIGQGQGSGALTKASVLPTKARHVKIVQTGSADFNWWSLYDLQIMGE